LLTGYYSGDELKKYLRDGACRVYGREQKFIQGFGGKKWSKETTWKIQTRR